MPSEIDGEAGEGEYWCLLLYFRGIAGGLYQRPRGWTNIDDPVKVLGGLDQDEETADWPGAWRTAVQESRQRCLGVMPES